MGSGYVGKSGYMGEEFVDISKNDLAMWVKGQGQCHFSSLCLHFFSQNTDIFILHVYNMLSNMYFQVHMPAFVLLSPDLSFVVVEQWVYD